MNHENEAKVDNCQTDIYILKSFHTPNKVDLLNHENEVKVRLILSD